MWSEDDDQYMAQKACAMKAAVANFYSRYANQSWKNVISIWIHRIHNMDPYGPIWILWILWVHMPIWIP